MQVILCLEICLRNRFSGSKYRIAEDLQRQEEYNFRLRRRIQVACAKEDYAAEETTLGLLCGKLLLLQVEITDDRAI